MDNNKEQEFYYERNDDSWGPSQRYWGEDFMAFTDMKAYFKYWSKTVASPQFLGTINYWNGDALYSSDTWCDRNGNYTSDGYPNETSGINHCKTRLQSSTFDDFMDIRGRRQYYETNESLMSGKGGQFQFPKKDSKSIGMEVGIVKCDVLEETLSFANINALENDLKRYSTCSENYEWVAMDPYRNAARDNACKQGVEYRLKLIEAGCEKEATEWNVGSKFDMSSIKNNKQLRRNLCESIMDTNFMYMRNNAETTDQNFTKEFTLDLSESGDVGDQLRCYMCEWDEDTELCMAYTREILP